MFIQIIQGKCRDADEMRRLSDEWRDQMAPMAEGWLGGTYGITDDNVHFANTLSVIDKLIEHGKYVEVMPFPGRGHGVSDPSARIVLMNRVTQFFLENLGQVH